MDDRFECIVDFDCGCKVVFDPESGYRNSRLDACCEHNFRHQFEIRSEIVAEARVKRDALMATRN